MLFRYFIIFVCFYFMNVNCDVRASNRRKRPLSDVTGSPSISQTEIIDVADNVGLVSTINATPVTPLLNTDQPVIKRKVTRVRKNKRFREPSGRLQVSKHLEDTEVNKAKTEKQRKEEENMKKTEIVIEQTTPIYKEVIERKQVIEKSDSASDQPGSSIKTAVPKTFPKRAPEFNPVFKKAGGRQPLVRIITEKNFVYGHNGDFHYSFEGGDGTKVYSKGNLISANQVKAGEAVEGGFSYTDKEGNDYSLSYTADENGYRPVGAHLPTPPPIPPEIARALEFLATKSTPASVTREYSDY